MYHKTCTKESKWISPVVEKYKNTTSELRIFVNLRKLHDGCLHDPFPTPFANEVLDSVEGQ